MAILSKKPQVVTEENWRVILDTAMGHLGSNEFELAEPLFLALSENEFAPEWGHFGLGQIAIAANNTSEAIDQYDTAIELRPRFFWAIYNKLLLLIEESGQSELHPELVGDLIKANWPKLKNGHVSKLELVAHMLWEAGSKELGAELLHELTQFDSLTQNGLARALESSQSADLSQKLADRLNAENDLNPVASKVLSDHYFDRGQPAVGYAILEKAWSNDRSNFAIFLAILRHKIEENDLEDAKAFINQGKDFPPRQLRFCEIVLSTAVDPAIDSFTKLRSFYRIFSEIPKTLAIRTVFALGADGDLRRKYELIQLLEIAYPNDDQVTQAKFNEAMREQDLVKANEIYDANFANRQDKNENMRLARIELKAVTGDIGAAAELLQKERGPDGQYPARFLLPSMRIDAELGNWDDIVDRAIAHLDTSHSPPDFFNILIRAARHSNRRQELYSQILNQGPEELSPSQRHAIFALAEDLIEAGNLSIGDIPEALNMPLERRYRIDIKTRKKRAEVSDREKVSVYYCADENYLIPAAVSLTSLIVSNVQMLSYTDFSLIVEPEIRQLAEEKIAPLRTKFGASIKVVDIGEMLESRDVLKSEYGMFTAGQTLSLAAYYRIFFAHHLAQEGKYSQALYIDADSTVRGGIDKLFDEDLEPAPLMARTELDRPEVRRTAKVHNLKGKYFNSGVLKFNFKLDNTASLIRDAIDVSLNRNDELIFQDQCALNIAFDENVKPLPKRYNYFMNPGDEGAEGASDHAVIVHYLDRPKPWDSLYKRRAREWFEWYAVYDAVSQVDSY